jgi:hypothetical protein
MFHHHNTLLLNFGSEEEDSQPQPHPKDVVSLIIPSFITDGIEMKLELINSLYLTDFE